MTVLAGCMILTGCRAPAPRGDAVTATSSLRVEAPAKARPFPEPLAPGEQPGFKLRGIKGWAWTPQQYLDEIPWLTKFKMNFMMNCYSSLFTTTHPWNNEWWKLLPDETKTAFADVIHASQTNGINFCFCMNPQLASKRPLDPTSTVDLEQLFQHYAWAQSLGVKWFSICVDDVGWGKKGPVEVGSEDAKMVNTILGRLRAQDPEAQMIFCPGPYHGDGSQPEAHAYLQALGQELNPDVYIFWVGDETVTPRITRAAAESYKRAVGHRLFLWDNYPVNDYRPTLNLGPVAGRAADLCQVADGYMSNPMDPQNQINRVPTATCADYAYNPRAYDPGRSIGQSILLLGKTHAQRKVLRDLVETYPGFIVTGGGTGTNPVRNKFKQLAGGTDPEASRKFLRQIEDLSLRMEKAFPAQFDDAKKTIRTDVEWMKKQAVSAMNRS